MDNEIAELDQEISKSINEVAKEFELKYRDFVPSYICLADCQEKIQSALHDGEKKLKKLDGNVSKIEKDLSKIKEEVPQKKLEVVQGFIEQLAVLNDVERCFNSLWLLPADNDFDAVSTARTIMRLEELCTSLESENSNHLDVVVNERILPLLISEVNARKNEVCQRLDDFYRTFLDFKDDEQVSPPIIVMTINCNNAKAATDAFTAMHRLKIFTDRLEEMVDAVWEQFCSKLIYCAESPESLVKVQTEKFTEHTMKFVVKKDVETTKKPDYVGVFSALISFFGSLQTAFKGIRVDDRYFVDLFGDMISARLISALEKGCLGPAIPFEKQKSTKIYAELTTIAQNFLQFMKEQGFFMQPVDQLFESFFNSYERISVDRRCHHFITTARELIKMPYLELVEVGSAEDDREEKSTDVLAKIEEKLRIKPDNEDASLSGSTSWDKCNTKMFQFRRSQISTSTFKLVNLIQEVLKSAAESDSDIEASRLLTTARNILEMFNITAPSHHRIALSSVPQIAAVFFNNCHYIVHRLITLPADTLQNIMKVAKISEQDCSFTDMFTHLRTLAANTLEQHIIQARRQISASIGEGDIFVGLNNDNAHKHCVKVMNACGLQIEQTANVWREVMSDFVFVQCVGEIVSHLLSVIADIILRKEDIASTDAEITADLMDSLMVKLKAIMTINGQPMIQKVCDEHYYKMQEIIFCLKGSLAEIGHRWCEGTGPLAMWLKAPQVKQLVRAIFQNTDRRAQLLAQIN